MKEIALKDIEIKGELAVRMARNLARIEDEYYRPDEVFTADQSDWPADWEGRIILALSLYRKTTGRMPAYLDEIVEKIPEHLNERGFLGRLLPAGQFAEQHMAGHSWLIRGLIEYYSITEKESVRSLIEQVVRNFLLPVKGSYKNYHITPLEREENKTNWVLSQKQSKVATHADTSDAGCAFIMIDGATAAYEFLGWEELHDLIEEMIERYSQMDFLGCHIQTHATLSGLRGVIRFYQLTGEKKYIELAEKMFALYKEEGWSEAYGNYNWFGVPSWTEPCAIIDSFIAAVTLWSLTKKAVYLEDGYKIFYNAIGHANRHSGSFGTDNCTGAEGAKCPTAIMPVTYDVYWCCNMRGGEALTRAAQYSFWTEGNTVYNTFYHDSSAELTLSAGRLALETRSMYPYDGKVKIDVRSTNICRRIKLCFFMPKSFSVFKSVRINGENIKFYEENEFVCIEETLNNGDRIEIEFDQRLECKDAVHKHTIAGYHKFFYGPLLLARKKQSADEQDCSIDKYAVMKKGVFSRFTVEGSGVELGSLYETRDMTEPDSVRQVLFR